MELTIEEALRGNYLFIDLRSEKEYGLSHIPFATSLPILDDTNREIVGIAYKNQGKERAIELGYSHVLPKLDDLISSIKKSLEDREVVLYCSRGGMRSQAIYKLLSQELDGLHRLVGGYKSYRRYLLEGIAGEIEKRDFLVFQGLTGVGKTRILKGLASSYNVLDLEGLASHRGSVFGGLGLEDQPGQKQFENNIFDFFLRTRGPILLEAESSKIGKLNLPRELREKMLLSPIILVESSLSSRVRLLMEEYGSELEKNKKELIDDIWMLKRRLGNDTCRELEGFLEEGSMAEAIELLLVSYYDPLYIHSIERARKRVVYSLDIDNRNDLKEIGKIIEEILYT